MAGTYKGNMARYNVVSFRASDEEFKLLSDLAGRKPISSVVRGIISDYINHLEVKK